MRITIPKKYPSLTLFFFQDANLYRKYFARVFKDSSNIFRPDKMSRGFFVIYIFKKTVKSPFDFEWVHFFVKFMYSDFNICQMGLIKL